MKLLFWVGIVLFMAYIVFGLIHQITADDLVYFGNRTREFFTQTTQTINMPINTRYSCQNFCGPTSRCAITGQQCFTDMDCSGCQVVDFKQSSHLENIPGDNSAGKLTVGQTPQYSSLTSGFGTQELLLSHRSKPDQANFGVNTWKADYDQTKELFDRRYKPNPTEFSPSYSDTYTLSGEFKDDGPLPSNY